MKIIGMFGWEQTDLCIYLASILENMGYHVLVIDNSREETMDCCIPKPKQELHTVTYKNVDYRRHLTVHLWKDEAYDFIIVDLGNQISGEEAAVCDELFFVTSCDRRNLENAKDIMLGMKRPMGVIIRNFCTDTLRPERILATLESENCFVMERFLLPFHVGDESVRVRMQYEGYDGICHISKALERMLFTICSMITQREAHFVIQGIRRAKKGECY